MNIANRSKNIFHHLLLVNSLLLRKLLKTLNFSCTNAGIARLKIIIISTPGRTRRIKPNIISAPVMKPTARIRKRRFDANINVMCSFNVASLFSRISKVYLATMLLPTHVTIQDARKKREKIDVMLTP